MRDRLMLYGNGYRRDGAPATRRAAALHNAWIRNMRANDEEICDGDGEILWDAAIATYDSERGAARKEAPAPTPPARGG